MPNVLNYHDPYSGYNFWVEWDKIIHAGFQECSGLDQTYNPVKYREGTDKKLVSRQVRGLMTNTNITLKRGIASNHELWDWLETFERREVSIVLSDNQGNELIRWNITNCWPTSWTGPSFNATSDEIATETLVLVHEGIVKLETASKS